MWRESSKSGRRQQNTVPKWRKTRSVKLPGGTNVWFLNFFKVECGYQASHSNECLKHFAKLSCSNFFSHFYICEVLGQNLAAKVSIFGGARSSSAPAWQQILHTRSHGWLDTKHGLWLGQCWRPRAKEAKTSQSWAKICPKEACWLGKKCQSSKCWSWPLKGRRRTYVSKDNGISVLHRQEGSHSIHAVLVDSTGTWNTHAKIMSLPFSPWNFFLRLDPSITSWILNVK